MNYYRQLFSSPEWYALRAASLVGKKRWFYAAYRKLKSRRADIQRLHNIHAGDRCFILGGGPSLLKMNPAHLVDEITFGVNGCFLIFDWLGFHPSYYVVEDSLVYEDRRDEILHSVTQSRALFPIQFRTSAFDRANFSYFRAVYDLDERPGWPAFSTNCSELVWIGGTVTYVCLQLAYYMGVRDVYLIGMDHTYTKPGHTITRGTEWTSQGNDPNHFHPDYFGKGMRWHDPRLDRMEKAYRAADGAFRRAGRRIWNATCGGALEVFDRVDYETLF